MLVSGINLHPIESASFGGVPAGEILPTDWGDLMLRVPTNGISGPIRVQTPAGMATSAEAFTVIEMPPPILDQVVPTQSAIGTEVLIRGYYLDQAQQVLFNGTPVRGS
jgi:hypothetical protein